MNNKTELINSILYGMIDELDKEQLGVLKSQLQLVLYNYDVSKIESTEVSIGNQESTKELLEYFSVCKLSSGRSKDTIKQYVLAAKQLCNFLNNKPLNMITTDDVIYFLAKYPYTQARVVSGCTMDSKRRYLSSIFGLLKKHKKIAENPMETVERVKYISKLKKPLNDIEIDNINKAIDKTKNKIARVRNDAIIHLCLDTGARVSELANIHISDIDFYKKEIKILGKGRKERIVLFSPETDQKIKDYLKLRNDIKENEFENNSPLFMDITNRYRLQSSGVRSMMKRLRKPSGVSRLHPHLLRATMASDLAKANIQIDIIAKYLGHAGLDVVQRYVTNANDRLHEELFKVGLG